MEAENKTLMDVNSYTASFTNARGKRIFCKYWEPSCKPRALVFIAHGFAEHCLPYDKLARTLASRSFFVFSHDHVGHGQSGGSRVHIDDFYHYVEDVFQHVEEIKRKFHNLPTFICGHSMGGAISILAALKKPNEFEGVILIGPAVSINPDVVTPFKIKMARFLRWVFPHFPVGSLDFSTITSCPKSLKMIEDDPLRWHGFCKASFGACFIDAVKEIQESLHTVTFPFVILQGEDDKICDGKGATAMYEKAISKDKTIKIYPKAYHCLFLEPNGVSEEVIQDITRWLEDRV